MNNGREAIYEAILEAFNGKPVIAVNVNKIKQDLHIVSCQDRPNYGLTSVSTLGLNNYNIGFATNNTPLRIELVGVCLNEFTEFQSILYSCALHVTNIQSCSPEAIYENIIEQHLPDSAMKHVLFVVPFLWGNKLEAKLKDKFVTWLHAIPISDSEYQFAKENSVEELENLFEMNKINIADLRRQPVI